jgi:transposase
MRGKTGNKTCGPDLEDGMSSWRVSAEAATPANTMNLHNTHNSEARAEQVAAKPYTSIKLGLDVHADSIMVVRIIDHSGPEPAQRFRPEQFPAWVQKQLALAQTVHSCYEAGPFGYALHRQLTGWGVQNVVSQPVCLDERHTGVNNDKTDARELALRLDRRVSGNPKALAVVRVPTPAEEQRRIQSRQREQLRREVHRVAAQGRSLLLSQGVRQKGRWWSTQLWSALRSELPAWLIERLEVFRRLLEVLSQELQAAAAALEAAAPKLRPIGLGALTYETIEREIGDWNRFQNRRQVGSYTGLCGGISASGGSVAMLSITKHGNPRLRAALIELAWRLLLWQPQSVLVRKWERVLGNVRATRAARKKAIVAIARQMAVDLWRWRTGRARPEALGWRMQPA